MGIQPLITLNQPRSASGAPSGNFKGNDCGALTPQEERILNGILQNTHQDQARVVKNLLNFAIRTNQCELRDFEHFVKLSRQRWDLRYFHSSLNQGFLLNDDTVALLTKTELLSNDPRLQVRAMTQARSEIQSVLQAGRREDIVKALVNLRAIAVSLGLGKRGLRPIRFAVQRDLHSTQSTRRQQGPGGFGRGYNFDAALPVETDD